MNNNLTYKKLFYIFSSSTIACILAYLAITYYFYTKRPETITKAIVANPTLLENTLNSIEIFGIQSDIILWGYDNEYKKRYQIFSTESLKLEPIDIKEDKFYTLMLLYHTEDICYTGKPSNFPVDTLARQLIEEFYETDQVIYSSCPVYVDNILVGYVSGVFEFNDTGVVELENFMKLVAGSTELYIKDLY